MKFVICKQKIKAKQKSAINKRICAFCICPSKKKIKNAIIANPPRSLTVVINDLFTFIIFYSFKNQIYINKKNKSISLFQYLFYVHKFTIF